MVPHGSEEQQVPMPGVQTFAERPPRFMKGVDQGGFHQSPFINRPPRLEIGPGRPFDHPMKDLKLAVGTQPGREAIRPQVIDERLLAWSRADRQERAQLRVEQVLLQLEAAQPALWIPFSGGLQSELVLLRKRC